MVWHASKRMLRPEEIKERLGIALMFQSQYPTWKCMQKWLQCNTRRPFLKAFYDL